MTPLAIGIDVGGTKVAGGVVDPDGQVRALTRADTPGEDAGRIRAVIMDLIRELAADRPVAAVGIGAAGWVDATRDTVRFAPHLAWRDEPLRDHVAAAVAVPVVVENDANAAAWGELRFGAGRDSGGSLVLVTVGTGIGGGLVVGGELVRGAHGFAGEPGHQQVVPEGLPCRCGRRGCLEQYASGQALVRYLRDGQPGAETITGPQVTTAARAGDPRAREAFDQIGSWLGVGLANLAQVLDPQVIVVGGGVAEAGELLLAPARRSYRRALGRRGELPVAKIRPGQLGTVAGVVGAADLARCG